MELAKEFGANTVFDSRAKDIDKQVSDFTGGKGFDAVIDIAGGRETVLKTCFKYVRDRGTLILFGLYGSEKVKLEGVPINDIIFGMRDLEVKYENKRIHVKGITGREGIWEYLIDTVAVSRELRKKIMKPVTVMGPLENLGQDTLKLNRKKVMKRAYTAFGKE
jgi:threonine dehydrogenase-like Zn-dependent dehydrogenase